MSAVGPESLM